VVKNSEKAGHTQNKTPREENLIRAYGGKDFNKRTCAKGEKSPSISWFIWIGSLLEESTRANKKKKKKKEEGGPPRVSPGAKP